MSRRDGNVGDIPEVTADEDVDRDVEIMEEMARRLGETRQRTSRQILEDMRDEAEEVSGE